MASLDAARAQAQQPGAWEGPLQAARQIRIAMCAHSEHVTILSSSKSLHCMLALFCMGGSVHLCAHAVTSTSGLTVPVLPKSHPEHARPMLGNQGLSLLLRGPQSHRDVHSRSCGGTQCRHTCCGSFACAALSDSLVSQQPYLSAAALLQKMLRCGSAGPTTSS